MPKQITNIFSRLKAGIGGFSAGQKTVAIIGIAVLILGIVGLASWASKPSLTPLFTGIPAEDANAIVEQLRTDNVEYQLTDGGSTILVPEQHVYEERLKAAAAGLPNSAGGGYALLDKMGVTSSDFQQSTTYKRALEGELEKTVSAVKGVKTARVQLAIPEETVFVREKEEATASVFLETRSGATLTTDQVNSITHLVSASIQGMKPENVSVIDADGRALSTVGTGAAGGVDSQASDYEDRVRANVQQMLDRIVGSGNATVAVTATVSNQTEQVTSETFTQPDDVAPLSESTETEQYAGTGGAGAGILGPDNIAVPGGGAGGNGNYESEKTVRNNSVNKETSVRNIPAGAVSRQAVSVAISSGAAEDVDVTQNELEALVAAAAGSDTDRGDTVEVRLVGFSTADAEQAQQAIAEAKQNAENERLEELLRTGLIAVAIALPILILALLFLRRGRQRREPIDLPEITETDPADQVEVAATPELVEEVIPAAPPTPSIEQKRADIARLAAQDPERMAAMLRSQSDERTS